MIRQPDCKPDLGIDLGRPWHPVDVLAVGTRDEGVDPCHVNQCEDFRGLRLREPMCLRRLERGLIPPPGKERPRYQFPVLGDPQLFGRPVVRYLPHFGHFDSERVRLSAGAEVAP